MNNWHYATEMELVDEILKEKEMTDHRDYGDEDIPPKYSLAELAQEYRKERVPYSTYLYVYLFCLS